MLKLVFLFEQVYRHTKMAVPAKRHRGNLDDVITLVSSGALGVGASASDYRRDFVRTL